jgi:hypothetical protein
MCLEYTKHIDTRHHFIHRAYISGDVYKYYFFKSPLDECLLLVITVYEVDVTLLRSIVFRDKRSDFFACSADPTLHSTQRKPTNPATVTNTSPE